ncbi:L-ribulose-5-phosphate 4-epimerase UlaF [Moorella thermoacetica]|uniref:L-ribulose-5-phosphate 4-epimerase n=1 Tax=Neomoorella thermoacetica TaxID=1525 RepID=A0AAC9HH14_NEOTH|nr:L-ribulose-5-phosphate 4-epimerase [Moorella thermoacetica]AOQ23644.1 L-ribulose-5-phosphate 4-epimerase UlaF [Moorella thermoacetica]TYL13828.1 L-ribulose-5-phosphate 4-epimerase UlaF [Moorella thermoacetica]
MLAALKERVYKMNLMLPKNNLVTMTSGNVSGRDIKTGYVVIKPSGVLYEEMKPEDMVVVDLNGNIIEGKLRPSVDTPTHLYVYRHRQDVNGIVHTHSPYATSFAALGKSIPVYLTAIADEFGGPIPVGPYAQIGGEEIGKAIVEHIGDSPAILMKHHGVFAIGKTPESAVKAAVMVEDVAQTVYLALTLGQPEELPPAEVKRAHERYMTAYGQGA